ncbi:MAG: bis(5'-nucleosyl)-tetraphosphatase (symmetrical) YqeK [Oscillospiraceae bacterium]|nr:bis(5'-nucleosyl)-tetraphosphatase (symmetrical) YqeK [Oscillospiraceae bacterium]MBQ4643246.1 bis(5'-nucleosyl)-tetraphosphatase (symmetrical) YqeK [Oscillospiraceae bacterium]
MMETKKFCPFSEEEIKAVLKARMNEHRFEHSLNVAERAAFLAEKYGADIEKAAFAGLIHDICKGIPKEEQLSVIEKEGISLDEDTLKSPALWHSIAGAIYSEHELGVTDKDVLNAIRYHTSGRGNMSILEKVVYMADLTSAERNYPDAQYTRDLTDYSLDEGIAYGVRWIAGDLEKRGFPKGKDTEALLEEYKNVEITFEKG